MKGSLSTVNVADLLLDLHRKGQTGVLRLTREDLKKNIYFVEGKIVFAHSNLKQDRLGETLLRLGKITPEEFEIASTEVIQMGKRLGESLCDRGFLSPGEVISGVHYQLQHIIYSVFDWDQGDYEFVEKDRPVFEDIIVEISTSALLIEGIRSITNTNVLHRCYGGDETQIVIASDASPALSRTDLEFSEETLMACVDGKRSIAAIRKLTHLAPTEFDRALFSLLLSEMIRLTPASSEAPAPSHVETGFFSLEEEAAPEEVPRPISLTTRPMSDSNPIRTFSEEEMRARIVETEQRFREATDEEVLGVFPDATQSEITEAYDHFFSLYHPYYLNSRFDDLSGVVKSILDRLGDANMNLQEKVRSQLPLEAGSFSLELNPDLEEPAVPSEPAPTPPAVVEEAIAEQPRAQQELPPDPKELNLMELQQQVRLHPDNLELLRQFGRKLQEAGKPQDAEKHLLRALELEPQNVENHLTLADFYQKQSLRIKAFKHLNIVMQLDPENARAMEMLGVKKIKKALYEISGTD